MCILEIGRLAIRIEGGHHYYTFFQRITFIVETVFSRQKLIYRRKKIVLLLSIKHIVQFYLYIQGGAILFGHLHWIGPKRQILNS